MNWLRTPLGRAALAIGVCVVAALGIAFATRSTPAHHTVAVQAPIDTVADTTTTTDAPTTTTNAPVTTTVAPTTTTPAVVTEAPTAPAPPPCLNSTDPVCGPFSWAFAPPAKLPMLLTIGTTVTGQTATFHTTVHDDQLGVDRDCVVVDYGDGVSEPASCATLDCAAAYGPWAPPAATPDDFINAYTHTYATAGTYTATFTFATAPACDNNPFVNSITKSAVVTVTS